MPKVYKWDGKPISKQGAYYGVPIEVYHSAKLCDGLSVSSTGLKKVRRSLAHFWADCKLNPERAPSKGTRALDTGKAAHCRVFEPEKFGSEFEISPFPDFRTNDSKAWRDNVVAEGKTVLNAEEFALIARMADRIRENELALSLFADGLPELTYAAKDEATGIWMLTRPDFLPASMARGPSDYKTAVSAEPEKWGRQAFDLGYPMQVGLALDVLEIIEGERRPTLWHVVQEKEEPYVVECFRWEQDQIAWGSKNVRGALDKLGRAWELHNSEDPVERARAWPGYSNGPVSVVTPGYLQRQLDADI